MDTPQPKTSALRTAFSIFFWVFNISLLILVCVGYLPLFGVPIFNDAAQGEVPFSILLPAVGLVGVPATSTVMGGLSQRQFRAMVAKSHPISLAQIFFGLEAPLLLVCTIRLFFLRDLTAASGFIFATATIGTLAFCHWLFYARTPALGAVHWGHLVGLTLATLLSTYLAAIALFYAPPIGYASLMLLGVALTVSVLVIICFPLGVLLLGWISMPFGMLWVFFRAWKDTVDQLAMRYGKAGVMAVVAGLSALWVGGVVSLQQQPQIEVFQMLDTPPQTESDRQTLLDQSDKIRRGLLNAYLGAYRYPSLEDQHIYQMYAFWTNDEIAHTLQDFYNWVVSPFAYRGHSEDKEKAARLYAEFFDTPILRGEQAAIEKAVISTFDRTQAKAGLLDVKAERVLLQEQDIQIKPHGDWAEVELHEVYANQTSLENEILYYFSLPESATITGLWLGETRDRTQRYEPVVSPRGAAQQVYTDQVQRRVDPALLEQVGPRNYRLRAFPIPPKGQDRLPQDGQPDRMHLWMTYRVLQQDGQWPLPTLQEQRNVFWNADTQRFMNGQLQVASTDWLPPSVEAEATTPQPHQTQLPAGYIVAKPLAEEDYQLPQGKNLALILDTSYSMAKQREELRQTWDWLQQNIVPHNRVTLFVPKMSAKQAETITEVSSFAIDQTQFFGWPQPHQMLQQFQQAIAPHSEPYDGIVLITDSGSYELSQSSEPITLKAPLWMVHLGQLQAAYDDATVESIQRTGGGVTRSLQDALERIATQPTLGDTTSLLNVTDGYAWFLTQKPDPQLPIDPQWATFAARQWITQATQSIQPTELQELDAIHTIAKQQNIVSPYSSMLVLVNDQQREQLKQAEQQSDRFQREIEDQQLLDPQKTLPPVTAVPEPEEWILMLIAGLLLILLYRRSLLRLDAPQSR